jgi:outer membrane protein TolC
MMGLLFSGWGSRPGLAQPRPDGLGLGNFPRYQGHLEAAEAVELALQHSLEIAVARERPTLESAMVRLARSALSPKLGLGAYLTHGNTPMLWGGAPGVDPDFRTRIANPGALDLNAMLMVPLFTGGLFQAQLAAARKGERVALARLAFSLRISSREARVNYAAVQLQNLQLDSLNWELGKRFELVRLTEIQQRVGRSAAYIVLRAQAELARTRQDIARKEADVQVAEATLKTGLGLAMDSRFDYAAAFQPTVQLPELSVEVAQALAERPDLSAARLAVAQDDDQLAAALAEYSPKAYFVTMLEAVKTGPFESSGLDTGYQTGVVLSWQAFDGGARAAQVEKARANRRLGQLGLRQMELDATRQVVSTRARLAAASQNLELSAAELVQANEDLRIAELRFGLGRGILLEILDAISVAARARNDQIRAGFEWEEAYAELCFALGRL